MRSTLDRGNWRLTQQTQEHYPSAIQQRSAARCLMGGTRRLGLGGVAAMLIVLAAACTSAAPTSPGHTTAPAPGHLAASTKVSAVLRREGLAVPATYRQACAAEAEATQCFRVPAGPIPAALKRALHFPVLRAGQRCPATRGTLFNTSYFGGIAHGAAPVRVLVGNRRGTADLINPTSVPPWLGLKTLWFSLPSYQGPFVIRAKRLGRPGPVALGEGPVVGPLVVPPGSTFNSFSGWREVPGGLWVKSPGCYAWQVDGLGFSEIIVVRAVLH